MSTCADKQLTHRVVEGGRATDANQRTAAAVHVSFNMHMRDISRNFILKGSVSLCVIPVIDHLRFLHFDGTMSFGETQRWFDMEVAC